MGDKPIQPDTINTMLNLITDRYFYRSQTKFAKVMFLHVCVCPHEGGSTWAGTHQNQVHTPRASTPPPRPGKPPWADTTAGTRYTHPWTRYTLRQVHPRKQCMLGDTGNKRTVRILLECILVNHNMELNYVMCEQGLTV